MKLAELLTPELIALDLRAGGHEEAIDELVGQLASAKGLTAEFATEIIDSLKAREEQISTGIGSGVAIPHAFSDNSDRVLAVLGRSAAGIDFNSLDGQPVRLVILFVVPRKQYHLHLQTLAAIAKMVTNPEIRSALLDAPDAHSLLAILNPKSKRSAAQGA